MYLIKSNTLLNELQQIMLKTNQLFESFKEIILLFLPWDMVNDIV